MAIALMVSKLVVQDKRPVKSEKTVLVADQLSSSPALSGQLVQFFRGQHGS